MIRGLASVSVRLVRRWLPQPFTFAIILSLLTFAGGVWITERSTTEMVIFWGQGMAGLYGFTMQMVLVLVTGNALASSPIVKKTLRFLSTLPKTATQCVLYMAVIGCFCSYLNWAFGLIAGAIFAKELAARNAGKGLHYPLLIAAAYGGNVLRGPSSSIPLVIATPGHFLENAMGVIPVTQTLYSSWNLIITVILAILIPYVFWMMCPDSGQEILELDLSTLKDESETAESEVVDSPAKRLDHCFAFSLIFAFAGLYFCYRHFVNKGFDLTLDICIMIFLSLGLLAHWTPFRYVAAVNNAVKSSGGIILQFPFYAGIMGMMRHSGLAQWMADGFVSISTASTLPVWTFLSAGLINLFIPSGGGQWAVQGPIMIEAAQHLGADMSKVAMALTWGDSWTNQIQPFWALPLLAIANLGVRDIMGYCIVNALLVGVVCTLGFLIL